MPRAHDTSRDDWTLSPEPTARIAPWTRFEDSALDSRVQRRLFSPSRAMIVVCRVTSPTFTAPRINDLDEVTTVLEGRIEVRLGDRCVPLDRGQSIRIPAQTSHAVRALDDEEAEVLNVLFPPAAAAPTSSTPAAAPASDSA